jgi:pimeloyl-ACP methyl ester carboxylesterase
MIHNRRVRPAARMRSAMSVLALGCALVTGASLAVPGAAVAASRAAAPGNAATAAGAGPATGSLRVGSQLLKRCASKQVAYCGTLNVPLNWQASSGPGISVCYRWYPATAPGRAEGTVMPVEGGPGYPSILSVPGYRVMYGPALRHFNMLAIDLRGTGCSTGLDCPALQDYSGPAGSLQLAAVVGKCADALNHLWRAPGGGYVHASDLFTSAAAAQDVAAVIRALHVPQVDVYGDSYGSWFAQVFAARYPSLLRSVTLDSTYQVQGLDPWYRSTIATMPGDFDTVCAHALACAAAGGSSWPRIEALAHRLSQAPVSGIVPGAGGQRRKVSMGTIGLVNLVSDAAGDPAIYAALDAAARALLDGGQAAPLLRLYAQRMAFDEDYFHGPVAAYSAELYMAVSCLDYPQLYPMNAAPATRLADLKASEATLPASTFAPFSTAQWLAMNQNTENYTACLDWPRPQVAQTPIPQAPPFLPSRVPVLILGGELDTWTPPAGAPEVADEIGGDNRFVEFANETHVVGEGDSYGCAASIIQSFVADPAAIGNLDVSCAAAVPTVRAVGSFPGSLAAVPPLHTSSGQASPAALEAAAAGVLTAGDAVSRYPSMSGDHDSGLYGGSATAVSSTKIILTGDQLVPGVPVSGTVTVTGTGEDKTVTAVLQVQGPGGLSVKVKSSWALYGGSATAAVSLTTGSATASGSMPAPEGVPF